MQPQTSSLDDLLAWLKTLPTQTDKLEAAADELERVVSIPLLWPGFHSVMKLLIPVCAVGFIARCISVICIWGSGQFWIYRTTCGLHTLNAQPPSGISGGVLYLLSVIASVTRLLYDSGNWSPKYAVLFEGSKWPMISISYWSYCHGVLAVDMRIADLASPEEWKYKWRTRILNTSIIVIPILFPFTFVALWSTGTFYFARGYDTAQETIAALRSIAFHITSPESVDEWTQTLSRASSIYDDLRRFEQLSRAYLALLATSCCLLLLTVTPFWIVQVRLLLRMVVGVAHNLDPMRNGAGGDPSGTQPVVAASPLHSPHVLNKSMALANRNNREERQLRGQNVPADTRNVRVAATVRADIPPLTYRNFDTISLLVLFVGGYAQVVMLTIASVYTAMQSVHSSRFWDSENLMTARLILFMSPITGFAVIGIPVRRFFRRRRNLDHVEGPVSAQPRLAPSDVDSARPSSPAREMHRPLDLER